MIHRAIVDSNDTSVLVKLPDSVVGVPQHLKCNSDGTVFYLATKKALYVKGAVRHRCCKQADSRALSQRHVRHCRDDSPWRQNTSSLAGQKDARLFVQRSTKPLLSQRVARLGKIIKGNKCIPEASILAIIFIKFCCNHLKRAG